MLFDELDKQNSAHNAWTRVWDVSDLDNPRVHRVFDGTDVEGTGVVWTYATTSRQPVMPRRLISGIFLGAGQGPSGP